MVIGNVYDQLMPEITVRITKMRTETMKKDFCTYPVEVSGRGMTYTVEQSGPDVILTRRRGTSMVSINIPAQIAGQVAQAIIQKSEEAR